MNGVNALTAQQRKAYQVVQVMSALGRNLYSYSNPLQAGIRAHFAELSEIAWQGDSEVPLATRARHAQQTYETSQDYADYARYVGLTLVQDYLRRFKMD